MVVSGSILAQVNCLFYGEYREARDKWFCSMMTYGMLFQAQVLTSWYTRVISMIPASRLN